MLLTGEVGQVLTRLTFPMILAIASFSLPGTVDAYFLGQLGSQPLSALAFTFPIGMAMTSLAMGLGVGTAAVLARAIGAGIRDAVRQITTHAMWLALVIALALAGVGILTIDPLFRRLGATADILPLIREYMRIWYGGLPLLLLPLVGNSAIRATGDTRTPALVLTAAAGLHALLDPLFIFGWGIIPRLELAGAAWAMICSQSLAVLVSLHVLGRRKTMLGSFCPRCFWESCKQICHVGLPVAMSRIVFPISMLIITGLVGSYGPEAVAGLGVSSRVELLVMTVIVALGASLIPFVGQNWGAGQVERAHQGLRSSLYFALLWGLAVGLAVIVAAPWIARWWTHDPRVAAITTCYLRIASLSLGLQGVSMLVGAAFNAVNRPLYSTVITVVRMFVLYIPLAYAGSALFGLEGILAGACAANMVVGVASFLWAGWFFTEARGKPVG